MTLAMRSSFIWVFLLFSSFWDLISPFLSPTHVNRQLCPCPPSTDVRDLHLGHLQPSEGGVAARRGDDNHGRDWSPGTTGRSSSSRGRCPPREERKVLRRARQRPPVEEPHDLHRARRRPPMGGVAGAPPPAIVFPSSAGTRRYAMGDLRRTHPSSAGASPREPLPQQSRTAAAVTAGRGERRPLLLPAPAPGTTGT